MATSHQRRPDAATAERQAEAVAKAQIEKNQADLARDTRKALERQESAEDISQDAASQLQRGLGNSAVAALLQRGSETDTATTNAEATQQNEEEQDEEIEEAEEGRGEVERVLPSFSTGGGGGGGGPGGAPWAVGHLFGGDDDGDDELLLLFQPRWRPMAGLPDPDEEPPPDKLEDEDDAAAADDDGAWAEADARLGTAPWTPGVLSRGLRHPRRLADRDFAPERLAEESGAVWGRGRALLRWLGEHADDATVRALARACAAAGAPDELGYSGAVALQLLQLESLFALCRPPEIAAADVALDGRTRPLVERQAAAMIEAGALHGPTLLASVVGPLPEPVVPEPPARVHAGARAAIEAAGAPTPIPPLAPYEPPRHEPDLDAVDRVLRAFTGGDVEVDPDPPIDAREVRVLFFAVEGLLGAIGGVQVEVVGAAAAAWPYLAPGASGLVAELDRNLRATARRVLRIGQALESCLGGRDRDAVARASWEATAMRGAVEAVRHQAFDTLAALLDPDAPDPGPDELPGVEDALRAKRVEAARAALRPGTAQAASVVARLDGVAAAADALRALSASPGVRLPARRVARSLAWLGAAGDAGLASRDLDALVRLGAGGPYGAAFFAIAEPSRADRVAAGLREAGAGGALNLLKARFVEQRTERPLPPDAPAAV